MNFLKGGMRRLEQGLLEQIGATTSSKDASFDADEQRFKRLEDSLQRLSAQVMTYIQSIKKSCEDSRELVTLLDFFSSADVKQGLGGSSSADIKFLESMQALQRVQNGIKAAAARSVEMMMLERVIGPLGALLRTLPTVRRQMEIRRQALTDYDSYVRRLESLRTSGAVDEASVVKAESKLQASKTTLAESKALVASMLSDVEARRSAAVKETAFCLVACQYHFHRHAGDAVGPMLPLFPQAASTLVDLAGYTHLVAAAARPKGYVPPAPVPAMGLGSMREALGVPRGMTLPDGAAASSSASAAAAAEDAARRIPPNAVSRGPFATLHSGVVATAGKGEVSQAVSSASAVRASADAKKAASIAVAQADAAGFNRAAAVSRALSSKPDAFVRPVGPSESAGGAAAGVGVGGGLRTLPSQVAAPAPADSGFGSGSLVCFPVPSATGAVASSSSSASAAAASTSVSFSSAQPASSSAGASSSAAALTRPPSGVVPKPTLGMPRPGGAAAAAASPPDLLGIGGGSASSSAAGGSKASAVTNDLASLFAPVPSPAASTPAASTPLASASASAGATAAGKPKTLDSSTVSAELSSVPQGRLAEVKFDFSGSNPDELHLRKAQLLQVLQRGDDGWWTAKVLTAAANPSAPGPTGKLPSSVGSKGTCPYNYLRVFAPQEEPIALQKFGLAPTSLPWEGGASVPPPPTSAAPPSTAAPVSAVRPGGAAPPSFAAPPPPPGVAGPAGSAGGAAAAAKKPAVAAKPADDWGTADAVLAPTTSAAAAVAMRAPTATTSEFDAWTAAGAHKPHHGHPAHAASNGSGSGATGAGITSGTFDF